MEIMLNIYDTYGKKVVRTAKAETYDITFGTINELMGLVNVDKISDKMEMVKAVSSAWSEVIAVLSGFFPDVTPEEWKTVKVKELIPIIVDLVKYTFGELTGIPVDPKNA